MKSMEKNAYHKKLIQNLKNVLKISYEHFALLASFEVFWSLKNGLKVFIKNLIKQFSLNFHQIFVTCLVYNSM